MSKEMADLALASLILGARHGQQDLDTCALTALADRAEAYVATTVETVCRLELAVPAERRTARQATHLAEIKQRLETLEDLVTRLRELAAMR